MNHRVKLEELKDKLENAILSNSKEFRLNQQDIRQYHIALVNVLLQDAELRLSNDTLKAMIKNSLEERE